MIVSFAHKDSTLVCNELCVFDNDIVEFGCLTDDVVFSLYFVYPDCPRVFWKDVRVPMLDESPPSPRTPYTSPRAHRTTTHDSIELSFSYTTRRRYNPDYQGLLRELFVERTMQLRVLDEAALKAERDRVYRQERHCIVALLRMRTLTHYLGSPQAIMTAPSKLRICAWESARSIGAFDGIPLRKEYQWDAHVADARDLELIRGGMNYLLSPRVAHIAASRQADTDRTHNATYVLPLTYERPFVESHQLVLQFFNLKNVAYSETTLKWTALNACTPTPGYIDIVLAPLLRARVHVHKPKRRVIIITRIELIAADYQSTLENMSMNLSPKTV